MTAAHNRPLSVLIIEDEPNTLQRLIAIANSHPNLDVIGSGMTVLDGMQLLTTKAPDLLLTDLGLPDGSGIELIKFITEQKLPTTAMVITVFGDEKHVINAVKAGASGYILKDDNPGDIVSAIDQIMKGGAPISPSIAKYLLKYFQSAAISMPKEPEKPPLTDTEQVILQLVSKGYTAREIAEMNRSSYYTVTTHVRNIYKKLSINSRAEAVMEAIRLGLVKDENT